MPASRTFDYPISTLIRDAKRLHAQKKGFTVARNLAANTLYKMCLSAQNAARLAYPSTKADKDEAILVARSRFLLDEFPPRDRSGDKADDDDATPPPAPPAP